MKQPAWGKSPQQLVEAFAAAVADLPGAEPRKMFGFPAAFVNGNPSPGCSKTDGSSASQTRTASRSRARVEPLSSRCPGAR